MAKVSVEDDITKGTQTHFEKLFKEAGVGLSGVGTQLKHKIEERIGGAGLNEDQNAVLYYTANILNGFDQQMLNTASGLVKDQMFAKMGADLHKVISASVAINPKADPIVHRDAALYMTKSGIDVAACNQDRTSSVIAAYHILREVTEAADRDNPLDAQEKKLIMDSLLTNLSLHEAAFLTTNKDAIVGHYKDAIWKPHAGWLTTSYDTPDIKNKGVRIIQETVQSKLVNNHKKDFNEDLPRFAFNQSQDASERIIAQGGALSQAASAKAAARRVVPDSQASAHADTPEIAQPAVKKPAKDESKGRPPHSPELAAAAAVLRNFKSASKVAVASPNQAFKDSLNAKIAGGGRQKT